MNDDALKSLLRANAAETKIRSASEFWAEFIEKAAEADRHPGPAHGFRVMPLQRRSAMRRFFYPFLTSAASLAACALVYVALQTTPDDVQTLNSFEIGAGLQNNGAIVITDTPTDATILWVMTEES